MKKTIISILVILPLLLVAIIAVAGRIYGSHEYVEVTKIYFVNEEKEEISSTTIDIGQEKRLQYVIEPILASNKNVKFRSDRPDICAVNENSGDIVGVSAGKSDIIVETINNLTAKITVTVLSTGATEINLSHENLTGSLGCKAVLSASTEPAIEAQHLIYRSTDESIVKVNGQGREAVLSFVGKGNAKVIVTSRDGLTAECNVVVEEQNKPHFAKGTNIISDKKTIDLTEYLQNYSGQDIKFKVMSGENGKIEGNKLTYIIGYSNMILVKVYTDDEFLNYDEGYFIFN